MAGKILSKFITVDTLAIFLGANYLNSTLETTTATNGYVGNIPYNSIVFIKDKNLLWSHGKYFGRSGDPTGTNALLVAGDGSLVNISDITAGNVTITENNELVAYPIVFTDKNGLYIREGANDLWNTLFNFVPNSNVLNVPNINMNTSFNRLTLAGANSRINLSGAYSDIQFPNSSRITDYKYTNYKKALQLSIPAYNDDDDDDYYTTYNLYSYTSDDDQSYDILTTKDTSFSNVTLAWGGSTTFCSRLTNLSSNTPTTVEYKITLPPNPNTDSKVLLLNVTTALYRPLILGYNDSGSNMTKTVTLAVYFNTGIYALPSTATLYASKFKIPTGTSSLFLKADGSLDSTTYASTTYVENAQKVHVYSLTVDKGLLEDSTTGTILSGITKSELEDDITNHRVPILNVYSSEYDVYSVYTISWFASGEYHFSIICSVSSGEHNAVIDVCLKTTSNSENVQVSYVENDNNFIYKDSTHSDWLILGDGSYREIATSMILPLLNQYITTVKLVRDYVDDSKNLHVYNVTVSRLPEDMSVGTILPGVLASDIFDDIESGKMVVLQCDMVTSTYNDRGTYILGYWSNNKVDDVNMFYFYNSDGSNIFWCMFSSTSDDTLEVTENGHYEIADDSAVVHKTKAETITGAKTFSGALKAVTQAAGTNNTNVATTAFVLSAISSSQSDWNATSGSAAILNKPNISTHSGQTAVSQIMFGSETTLSGSDSNGITLSSVDEDIYLNAGGKAYYNNKEIATTDLVLNAISALNGALQYVGTYTPTASGTNTAPVVDSSLLSTLGTALKKGYTWIVGSYSSTSNTYFLGTYVEPGDMIIALVDNPGTTIRNYNVIQKNLNITDFLPTSGGTMLGPLKWSGSNALPEVTSPLYFLAIDAFANGGTTKWASLANVKSTLGLSNYLPLAGGTMTGAIARNYASASNDPVLKIGSYNLDIQIFKVYSSDVTYSDTVSAYGYELKYIGTGSGVNNYLQLIADNLTGTKTTAISINQSGLIGLGVNPNTSYRLYTNGNILATKFVTNGGTATLFVKGDGTLDSNTYLTTIEILDLT